MSNRKKIEKDYVKLNFLNIFDYFWENKFLYILFIFVFIGIGHLTYNTKYNQFTSKLEIFSLGNQYQNNFANINKFNLFNIYVNSTQKKLDSVSESFAQILKDPLGPKVAVFDLEGFDTHTAQGIDSQNFFNLPIYDHFLLEKFINKLRYENYLADSFMKYEYLSRENFTKEEDYISAIKKLKSQIKINPPNTQEEIKKIGNIQNIRKDWEIIFDGDDFGIYKNVLGNALQKINDDIKFNLKNDFDKFLKSSKVQLNNKINTIDQKIELEKKNENLKNQIFLSKTIENAKVAREINLSKNIFLNSNLEYIQEDAIENNKNILGLENLNSYLEGYVTLEKKIELMSERGFEDFINDKIISLINYKNNLFFQLIELDNLSQVFYRNSIFEDNSNVINYDIDSILHSNKHSYFKILAYYLILGFLLASILKTIFVLIKRR